MILCDDILFWQQHHERPELQPWERIEGGFIVDISTNLKKSLRKIKQKFNNDMRKLAETSSNTMAAFRGDKSC
jgi:hypothetical protein